MKMTTEEAFIKVLQMHGIEHAFGIIGSAMMPISDLFPAAGITFWDCAHECTAGMIADGYTRATGKMSMAIAQNGPGITNFVTPIKTAYWNHTPMLLVTPQAANKTIGQGGFQEMEQMALFEDMRRLSGGGPRPLAHGRGAEPGDRERLAPLGPGADQHPARLLDPGHRHRAAADHPARAARRRRGGGRAGGEAAVGGPVPGHPERRRRGAVRGDRGERAARRGARRAGRCNYQHNDAFPGSHPLCGRAARLQRLEGGDGADRQGRRRAGARHPAQPVLDAARLRHRLLAEERQGHPGRDQPRPHRPDQEGRRGDPGRREEGRRAAARSSFPKAPATRAGGRAGS